MKSLRSSIFFILFVAPLVVSAQYATIKTPTNVSIEVINFSEYSAAQLAAIESNAASWISQHNSQAQRVAPASGRYNCHNWAYHQSFGGTTHWMNANTSGGGANISKYWSGTPTFNIYNANQDLTTVAHYANGDHSARVTHPLVNNQRIYESKWGAWPRYRHTRTDCPYNANPVNHYRVAVSGRFVSCLYSTSSYSSLNISGASYDWSSDRGSVIDGTSSGSFTPTSNGAGTISVNITSPYSGTTIAGWLPVWIGPFTTSVVGVNGNTGVCIGDVGTFTAYWPNSGTAPGYTFSWTKTVNWNWQTSTSGQMVQLSVPYSGANGGVVSVNVNNGCGWSGASGKTVWPMNCGGGYYSMASESVYPNPTRSGSLSVEVPEAGQYEVAVSDFSGNVLEKVSANADGSAPLSLDVAHLPKGVYILQVSNGEKTIMNRVVIE